MGGGGGRVGKGQLVVKILGFQFHLDLDLQQVDITFRSTVVASSHPHQDVANGRPGDRGI